MGQTAYSIAMQEMKKLIDMANIGEQSLAPVYEQLADIVINVKSFGAVGDWNGTSGTDDTAAIQRAIASLNKGNTLYFPAGNYLYDGTPIEFISGEQNVISGTPESFITFRNMDKGIILGDGATNKTGIRFDTIGFIGVNTNYGIYADNYSSIRADNLKLTNFNVGFYGRNSWLSKFSKCDFRGNQLALDFNTSANGVVIDNCYFVLNDVGVKILGTSGFTISAGSFEQHTKAIVIDTGVLRSLNIKDVYFEANYEGSIVFNTADTSVSTYWKGIDISDCYFTCIDTPYAIICNTLNNGGSPNTNIQIIGSIRNNVFANNGSVAYVAGIKLAGNRVYMKLENNRAYNMSNGNDIVVYEENGTNSHIREMSFSTEVVKKGTLEFSSANLTNLVLTSENGTKWKIKVGNGGSLFTTS